MEIQLLELSVSDADLNQLASGIFVWPDVIRDVGFAVTPEGVRVTGIYQRYHWLPEARAALLLYEQFLDKLTLA